MHANVYNITHNCVDLTILHYVEVTECHRHT